MRLIRLFILIFLVVPNLSWADSSCSGKKCTTSAVIDTSTSFGKAITNAWLMNENAGTTIASLGTANTGTFNVCGAAATPQWTTNDDGKPAVDSYAYGACIILASQVNLTGDFTVVARFYPNFISGSGSGLLVGDTGSSAYAAMFDTTTYYISSGSYSTITYNIGTGAWKLLVITRSGTTVTLYSNGSLVNTTTRDGTIPIYSMFAYPSGGSYIYGVMDYVIVANGYVASSDDVSAISSNVWQFFCETSCGGGPGPRRRSSAPMIFP